MVGGSHTLVPSLAEHVLSVGCSCVDSVGSQRRVGGKTGQGGLEAPQPWEEAEKLGSVVTWVSMQSPELGSCADGSQLPSRRPFYGGF